MHLCMKNRRQFGCHSSSGTINSRLFYFVLVVWKVFFIIYYLFIKGLWDCGIVIALLFVD